MKITGIKPELGLTGIQSLHISMSYINELLTGYIPPEYEIDIDIEGAIAYAMDKGTTLCDLSNEEKSAFIKMTPK